MVDILSITIWLPLLFVTVLHFTLRESGFISALPYLTMVVVVQLAGRLADFVQRNGWMTTTYVRRTFNSIGFASQVSNYVSFEFHIYNFLYSITQVKLSIIIQINHLKSVTSVNNYKSSAFWDHFKWIIFHSLKQIP